MTARINPLAAELNASLEKAAPEVLGRGVGAARHPDVPVEEMEGWGVALACRRAGVPLMIVRAVSNAAGDRDPSHWDAEGAMEALAAVLYPLTRAR